MARCPIARLQRSFLGDDGLGCACRVEAIVSFLPSVAVVMLPER